MTQGIVVGSDLKQEWLLPWWWSHYSKHNSYPVAFFDFGMSSNALAWCKKRGIVYPVKREINLKEISLQRKEKWEQRYGEGIWLFRSSWFKKPYALEQSPFDVNCWLDLDCQVRGSLSSVFASLKSDIAMVKELDDVQKQDLDLNYNLPGEISYNSGVIVYRRNAEFLALWAEAAKDQNHLFLGDQTLLSRLIYLYDIAVTELPLNFNWFHHLGPNPEALILHFIQSAKLEILKQI